MNFLLLNMFFASFRLIFQRNRLYLSVKKLFFYTLPLSLFKFYLVIHPEGPSELLFRVAPAGHVCCNHELLHKGTHVTHELRVDYFTKSPTIVFFFGLTKPLTSYD